MSTATLDSLPFHSLYRQQFIRVAAAVPRVHVADVPANVAQMITLAEQAHREEIALVVFPELGITAYSNDDLFQQEALLCAAEDGLRVLLERSASLSSVLVVGMPLRINQRLYNVAVLMYEGEIYGVVPKRYVPNYREFYEKRHFTSGRDMPCEEIALLGRSVPAGQLIFDLAGLPGARIGIEVCEDVWAPVPPSTFLALGGATLLANLSASNITIGKSDYRRLLAESQSARCIAAYIYTAAGAGESTTDLAWDGEALIYENGRLLADSSRFSPSAHLVIAEVDLAGLEQDRLRMTSYGDSVAEHRWAIESIRTVSVPYAPPPGEVRLTRTIARFPYVPADARRRDERCFEAYNIQVNGLATRMRAAGLEKMVVGVSGGLDSTQALLVASAVADRLELGRTAVLAYTMPGFATSDRTLRNAHGLMQALGVQARQIDIRDSCMQMFRDIGHPYADGTRQYDVTFENVQAGERTSHLFRLANLYGGLVVGTGDLSELALGWTTYGVGDHMSHYAVNASIPKTLIQHLIRWVAGGHRFGEETSAVLLDILDTEISPELVPADGASNSGPAQHSEAFIGPYELQDFHIYYITRYGFLPSRVAYLAHNAWSDKNRGDWPEALDVELRHQYDMATIKHWLRVFLQRFFGTTQFKRSCIPNGPKIGSGGSLSPRGDWRAPSDSSPAVWLSDLERVPDR